LCPSNTANRPFLQSPSLSQKSAQEYARIDGSHPHRLVPFARDCRIPGNRITAGKPPALDALCGFGYTESLNSSGKTR
jgi:hypothetical protein